MEAIYIFYIKLGNHCIIPTNKDIVYYIHNKRFDKVRVLKTLRERITSVVFDENSTESSLVFLTKKNKTFN